jgi:murein DD-endopeptidase MepM/ murein hydrolase activator NlpD
VGAVHRGDQAPGSTARPAAGRIGGAALPAIDYIQLTPDGRLFIGDRTKLESYPYYGAEIHAAAGGPVVAVVDNLPDQVPGANPTGLSLDEYRGNHIVQDIGGGSYAFYAHLKPGSIRVKVGDKLTTGQPIAALGNSGNSSAPHLHFHVMSTPDPLMSNGLPFTFEKFRLDSRVASLDALSQLENTGGPVQLQTGFPGGDQANVMPLDLDVMTYPTR